MGSLFKSKKKEIILFLFSTLAMLLLALFCIETYYFIKNEDKWVSEVATFDAELGWSHITNYSSIQGGIPVSTNSLGFRSAEVDAAKDHVLVLGDSVAFGAGVGDHETVSYYLDQEFKEAQVLNLAVSGYGLGQYYLALKRHIRHTNPKHIVVVIYSGNDLADTRKDNLSGASKPLFVVENNKLKTRHPAISRYSCTNLLSRSWLSTLLPPGMLVNAFCKTTELDKNAIQATVKNLFAAMDVLANRHGAKLLFVLSPTLTAVEWSICNLRGFSPTCQGLDSGFKWNYSVFLKTLEHSSHAFLDFNSEIIRLYHTKNIDLKSLYNGEGKDIHHYSPRGNLFLAKTISRYLSEKSFHSLASGEQGTGNSPLDKHARANLDRGLEAWSLGQNEKAIVALRRFLQKRPGHAEAHFLLGLAYKNLGQPDVAIREIETSVRIKPEQAVPHNVLGMLYLKAQNLQNAIGEFKNALEILPDYPDAYFNLGLALNETSDGSNAALNILIASKLYEYAEQSSFQRMAEEKLAEVLKKHGIDPLDFDKRFTNPDWAIALVGSNVLKKLLVNDSDNIDLRYRLGSLYFDLNRYEDAAAEFRKVVEIFPGTALALNDLGVAQLKMERYQEAVKTLQEAIRLNEQFAGGHLNLAIAYDFLGHGRQAVNHALMAERLFSEFEGEKNKGEVRPFLKSIFSKYGYRREDFSEYPSKEEP